MVTLNATNYPYIIKSFIVLKVFVVDDRAGEGDVFWGMTGVWEGSGCGRVKGEGEGSGGRVCGMGEGCVGMKGVGEGCGGRGRGKGRRF